MVSAKKQKTDGSREVSYEELHSQTLDTFVRLLGLHWDHGELDFLLAY